MGIESKRPMVRIDGTVAAPGLAEGPLFRLAGGPRSLRTAGAPAEEGAALARALAEAHAELTRLAALCADGEAAAILQFQIALLEDEALSQPAQAAIDRGQAAEFAWRAALDAQIADYENAVDAYFRGRAADLKDLRERVLDRLSGATTSEIPPGAIVSAEDLAPSRFLAPDWRGGGIVLSRGSPTSHLAILARARGIPVVVGIDTTCCNGHSYALLDGEAGSIILDPDDETRRAFERKLAERQSRDDAERVHLARPARTQAGETVTVMVNLGSLIELGMIEPAHTDGVGLVRTEFLFQGREQLPGEEEQLAAYRRILDWAGGRPVIIRTLDAGGDKPIPGLTRTGESNPFLGVRGVRLSLRHPEVFRIQLRALARAAAEGPLKIMIPMVTLPEELIRCRALLGEAVAGLQAAGLPARDPELGMMVEVPAAALALDEFDADFTSIGSNDLIQYLTAASRDEPELAPLAACPPGLWRLVRDIVEHGRRTGREVSLCGDLAGDPKMVPALLDCGLRKLSVAPAALASVKAAVSRYRAGR
ncbi:MAG TPA: phosphoenolpyruvate--protein phosphotransferase [Alphaproteobacteria bacterium]|nr:phosphoenolpyruvate--protein phosphotransferase [Alphaproteobacteria bacterium]